MLSLDDVLREARGHWAMIFASLAPQLNHAMEKAPKHVPCPVHGGKDGFRFFASFREEGAGICNTCGAKPNGIQVLMWVNGWDFKKTLEAVYGVLHGADVLPGQARHVPQELYEGVLVEKGYKALNYGVRYCVTLENTEGERTEVVGVDLKDQVKDLEEGTWLKIRFLGYESIEGTPHKKKRYEVVSCGDPEKHAQWIKQLWDKAKPESERIKAYLASRRIDLAEPLLLRESFHQDHAIMMAPIMTVDGRLVSLHSTYLAKDHPGKAPIETPKRIMKLAYGDTITGAAIPLFAPVRGVLALTEGIETALSVRSATGLPVWACISANGLKAVELPQDVHCVFIFADHDASGVGFEAASHLRARLESQGKLAFIFMPSQENTDWNDVLQEKGKTGFPLEAMSEGFYLVD